MDYSYESYPYINLIKPKGYPHQDKLEVCKPKFSVICFYFLLIFIVCFYGEKGLFPYFVFFQIKTYFLSLFLRVFKSNRKGKAEQNLYFTD